MQKIAIFAMSIAALAVALPQTAYAMSSEQLSSSLMVLQRVAQINNQQPYTLLDNQQPAQPDNNQTAAKADKVTVMVKPGDTLTTLAKNHQTTWERLFNANETIKDPDVIYPGLEIRVPGPDEQLTPRQIPQDVAPVAVKKPATTIRKSTTTVAKKSTAVVAGDGVWDKIAACESGGNWSINTGNGYFGGLQFTLSSWRAVGGSGYPHQASREEQIMRGEKLQAIQGWGAWPACSAKIGLL